MGRFWVLALFGSLPGCFSPAVTVASLAADGVSYAASGETVADRGLSVVTARDCELLLRIVDGRPVCVDRPVEEGVPVEDRRRPHYFLVVIFSSSEASSSP